MPDSSESEDEYFPTNSSSPVRLNSKFEKCFQPISGVKQQQMLHSGTKNCEFSIIRETDAETKKQYLERRVWSQIKMIEKELSDKTINKFEEDIEITKQRMPNSPAAINCEADRSNDSDYREMHTTGTSTWSMFDRESFAPDDLSSRQTLHARKHKLLTPINLELQNSYDRPSPINDNSRTPTNSSSCSSSSTKSTILSDRPTESSKLSYNSTRSGKTAKQSGKSVTAKGEIILKL